MPDPLVPPLSVKAELFWPGLDGRLAYPPGTLPDKTSSILRTGSLLRSSCEIIVTGDAWALFFLSLKLAATTTSSRSTRDRTSSKSTVND